MSKLLILRESYNQVKDVNSIVIPTDGVQSTFQCRLIDLCGLKFFVLLSWNTRMVIKFLIGQIINLFNVFNSELINYQLIFGCSELECGLFLVNSKIASDLHKIKVLVYYSYTLTQTIYAIILHRFFHNSSYWWEIKIILYYLYILNHGV